MFSSIYHSPLFRLILVASLFGSAGTVSAQKLFTKDGQTIDYTQVTMSGTIAVWKTKDPATGGDKTINIPAANIVKVEFPEPQELDEGELLLIRGDIENALKKFEAVLQKFSPFKATPGSHYIAAALCKLEALAILKQEKEYGSLRTELKTLKLGENDTIRYDAAEAQMDAAKGILAPALKVIALQLPKTDNAAILAKLHALAGDIHAKKGALNEALESYLTISVLYGSQGNQLPRAELNAARILAKQQHLEDARDMLQGIIERHAKTPEAKTAKAELDVILKTLENVSQAKAEADDQEQKVDKSEKQPAAAKPSP